MSQDILMLLPSHHLCQPQKYIFSYPLTSRNICATLDDMVTKLKNGQQFKTNNGYIVVYQPDHPRSNAQGFVFEHILILEKKLGRKLLYTEDPHHINLEPDDNKEDNLIALTKSQHRTIHQRIRRMRKLGMDIPLTWEKQARLLDKVPFIQEKKDRNRMLEKYAESHPNASLKEIGIIFNISKQRVHELLKILKNQ